jgi:haloacetate dehalogenase
VDAEAIKRSLEGSGLRCTPQRFAVMAFLMEHTRHPTAAEIFEAVNRVEGPENELKAANDAQLARATNDVQREYLRTSSTMANIHAMCEDYRASASIDLEWDNADAKAGKKIQCPLLTLWAATGAMGKLYDVLKIWKDEGVNVTGKGLPGNHSLQESAPKETLAELQAFLRG